MANRFHHDHDVAFENADDGGDDDDAAALSNEVEMLSADCVHSVGSTFNGRTPA